MDNTVLRGIRGNYGGANSAEEIVAAAGTLDDYKCKSINIEDITSAFTVTADLNTGFPATAAREDGLEICPSPFGTTENKCPGRFGQVHKGVGACEYEKVPEGNKSYLPQGCCAD